LPKDIRFFDLLMHRELAVLLVHLVVFTGVGVAMTDVFSRVMQSLEPERGRLPALWLLLVGAIGGELFYAFDLFQFKALGWF